MSKLPETFLSKDEISSLRIKKTIYIEKYEKDDQDFVEKTWDFVVGAYTESKEVFSDTETSAEHFYKRLSSDSVGDTDESILKDLNEMQEKVKKYVDTHYSTEIDRFYINQVIKEVNTIFTELICKKYKQKIINKYLADFKDKFSILNEDTLNDANYSYVSNNCDEVLMVYLQSLLRMNKKSKEILDILLNFKKEVYEKLQTEKPPNLDINEKSRRINFNTYLKDFLIDMLNPIEKELISEFKTDTDFEKTDYKHNYTYEQEVSKKAILNKAFETFSEAISIIAFKEYIDILKIYLEKIKKINKDTIDNIKNTSDTTISTTNLFKTKL